MNTPEQTVPAGKSASPDDLLRAARMRRRMMLAAWSSAVLAALLVLSVLLTVDFAVVWSLGGFMHFDATATWVAAGAGAAACIWIAVKFFKTALRSELDLTRPDSGTQ